MLSYRSPGTLEVRDRRFPLASGRKRACENALVVRDAHPEAVAPASDATMSSVSIDSSDVADLLQQLRLGQERDLTETLIARLAG